MSGPVNGCAVNGEQTCAASTGFLPTHNNEAHLQNSSPLRVIPHTHAATTMSACNAGHVLRICVIVSDNEAVVERRGPGGPLMKLCTAVRSAAWKTFPLNVSTLSFARDYFQRERGREGSPNERQTEGCLCQMLSLNRKGGNNSCQYGNEMCAETKERILLALPERGHLVHVKSPDACLVKQGI